MGELVVLPTDASSPELWVAALERCGGNLHKFIAEHPELAQFDNEAVIGGIEGVLSRLEDKALYRRWEAAVRQNQIVRLRLLQSTALERLELLHGNPGTIMKMTEEIAFAKLVLGDVLAAQIVNAKKPAGVLELNSDDDDEEAARIIENG